MTGWAIGFLVVSVVFAIPGFSGLAGAAAGIARALAAMFLIVFVLLLLIGLAFG
jgi:uncharacterized membrane protein YtjA (UPF0391 family)